jgi:hypothetical protein
MWQTPRHLVVGTADSPTRHRMDSTAGTDRTSTGFCGERTLCRKIAMWKGHHDGRTSSRKGHHVKRLSEQEHYVNGKSHSVGMNVEGNNVKREYV